MFHLHETTRLSLCRLGFLALCAVPTCAVFVWIFWQGSDSQRVEHAKALSERFGLRVSMTRVVLPRPGVTLYEWLDLADPETGQRLARIPSLEIDCSGALPIVRASQAEINGARLDVLWEVIDRHLRGQTLASEPTVLFEAGELTLHLPAGRAGTLVDVAGRWEATPVGPQASLEFRPTDDKVVQPARLRIWRNRQTVPPATGFELDTAGHDLPCRWLASLWPPVMRLGEQCGFRGGLWGTQQAGRSDGSLTQDCLFTDLNLDALVTSQFPHKLGGRAKVKLQRARFDRGRLEEAAGELIAGPGVVGQSLLTAAQNQLSCPASGPHAAVGESLTYEQLALAFTIDPRGLSVQGQCSGKAAGAVLVDRTQTLLAQPGLQPQPAVNLVRMLVPKNEIQVPATRETGSLSQLLPLPSIVLPPGEAEPAPQARIRWNRP